MHTLKGIHVPLATPALLYPQSGGNSCVLVDDNLYAVWYSKCGTIQPSCPFPSISITALRAIYVGLVKVKAKQAQTYLLTHSTQQSPS
jgi:hypothetical protein